MKKIIIDTDPGVDDALAIALACYSDLSIQALTTVFGNSGIGNTTRNALTILELLGKKIPVFQGSSKPLKGKSTLPGSQGDNGLGGFKKTVNLRKKSQPAVSYLKNILENSEKKTITFVCMGPTTNLASLFLKRPELSEKIREIIILGGVFQEAGNITPYAEFNVFNDPYALQCVLRIKCKKILIPINICRKVLFELKDFDGITNKKVSEIFKRISELYIQYYRTDKTYGGFKGGVMYDLLTIAYVIAPRLFKIVPAYVIVETSRKRTKGKTTIRIGAENNCFVVQNTNPQLIKKLFFDTMNRE